MNKTKNAHHSGRFLTALKWFLQVQRHITLVFACAYIYHLHLYVILGDADTDKITRSREVVAFYSSVGIVDATALVLLLPIKLLQLLLGNHFVAFPKR